MARIEHDMSHWPLLIVRFPTGPTTDADIERFIAEQREMLTRNERFVELADARRATVLPATQRKLLADWLKESQRESARLCVGLSTVVPSSVIRGAMQAVLWLVTPPMPVKMGGTLEECAAHCRDWLVSADLPGRGRAEAYLAHLDRTG